MTIDELDIAPLEWVVQRLAEGMERYRQDVADEQIRDGLIQRFELTYEISHRMLRRYLNAVSPTPGELAQAPFQ